MALPHSQTYRASVSIVVVSTVVGLALWYHLADPNTAAYAPVVQLLPTDKFSADERGRIDLAGQFPGLTPHDEMFLTRRSDQSFLALFPTYYGRGTSLVGLMYTSRPLQEDDTFASASAPTRRFIGIGSWRKLSIDKRLDEHWYLVSHNLH